MCLTFSIFSWMFFYTKVQTERYVERFRSNSNVANINTLRMACLLTVFRCNAAYGKLTLLKVIPLLISFTPPVINIWLRQKALHGHSYDPFKNTVYNGIQDNV